MEATSGIEARAAASRRQVTHGARTTFRVLYRPTPEGIAYAVAGLPGVTGTTTGRKGLVPAARLRIALELDVATDAFALELERVK